MVIKEGDFIELDYTGKLKEDSAVFDTTDEKLAKEAGIYSKNMAYGPVIICVGKGQILKGLERKFIGKKEGKFSVDLLPEEGFGKKNAGLIELIPNKKFIENKIQPVIGLQVNIDGALGIVRREGGGRILVDFNHPLSGREITYDINIKRMVTDKKEQISGLLSILIKIKPVEIKIEKDEAIITLKQELPKKISEHMKKEICDIIKLKKVDFKKAEESAGKKDSSDKKNSEQEPEQ
ncbi:FKBP-type peptidyl-prolyl cis-trans isomerase [Candidatus Woesearchaeota archaeon]|nr:FKBP-type peptidyl-prolyl cis-trans isomerase [Candidatus Woesearchaeota archaeon]